jgi:hypothetical protein
MTMSVGATYFFNLPSAFGVMTAVAFADFSQTAWSWDFPSDLLSELKKKMGQTEQNAQRGHATSAGYLPY